MQSREWTFQDKSTWGDGPWQGEPDKTQWIDETTGLPCLVVRNHSGSLCGYVGVSEGHSLFNVEYFICPQQCGTDYCHHRPESALDVHGGITFTDFCHPNKEHGICHIVDEGENGRVWWFGFDTAHFGDLSPAYASRWGGRHDFDTYKDLAYIKAECAKLAEQLIAL